MCAHMQTLAYIIADLVGLVKDPDSAIHGCWNVTSLTQGRDKCPFKVGGALSTPILLRVTLHSPQPAKRKVVKNGHSACPLPYGYGSLGGIPNGLERDVDSSCPPVVHFATSGKLCTLVRHQKEEATMSEPFIREMIITRALSDATFRAALAADPERTLAKAGIEVTPDQLKAIVLARPAEWGDLSLEDVIVRIDTLARKR